jgi:hypothetical protein
MIYYVTMTDRFLSGWGAAKCKRNKLIFICDSREQAEIVEANARHRTEMKYINICTTKPWYDSKSYYVQIKTAEEYPSWYQKDYFKLRKESTNA